MELKVLRKELTARSTIGELHVDGKFGAAPSRTRCAP